MKRGRPPEDRRKTCRSRIVFGLHVALALFSARLLPAAIVDHCDETGLTAAVAEGGLVTFVCDGTIPLTHTLVVQRDLTLDASGHQVTLSGGLAVRVFDVSASATLTLVHLTLADGRAVGMDGAAYQPGRPGQGGAMRVQDAAVIALDCHFTDNVATGGAGGDSSNALFGPPGSGGIGEGGAIALITGAVFLSNCSMQGNLAVGGSGGAAASGGFGFGGIGGASRGGAIYIASGQVAMDRCALVANRTDRGLPGTGMFAGDFPGTLGGALYLETGALVSSNGLWRGNAANTAGGAILNQQGAVRLTSCTFDGNAASSDTLSRGGALFSASNSVQIVACLFTNNSATGSDGFILRGLVRNGGAAEGGAVCVLSGTAGIVNSAFVNNHAQGGDGFLSTAPGPAAAGSGRGGAWFGGASVSVLNSTFAGNTARCGQAIFPDGSAGIGGGVANFGGSLIINYSTIASNSASDNYTGASQGGGCYLGGDSLILYNTILSGNTVNGSHGNAFGAITDGGHNLSSDQTPLLSAAGSRNNVDPKLAPLGNNGGTALTMALLFGSPAIDAGDEAECPPTDQRGVARPAGLACDIGAFEFAPDFFFILSIARSNGATLRIRGMGVPSQTFKLQASPTLADWEDAASGVVSPAGLFQVETTNEGQWRFYRTMAR